MNHVDPGDTDTVARPSRRALLGAGIGAGVLGTALAALGGPAAIASGTPEGDRDLLGLAMQLELTARDLYDEAIAAGASLPLFSILREQHESYAQAIAGATGLSARGRNEDVFSANRAAFASSDDTAVAAAGYQLESIASATHQALLGAIAEIPSARLVASICIMESRHATVLADASGQGDDLDALLDNNAEPLTLEDVS